MHSNASLITLLGKELAYKFFNNFKAWLLCGSFFRFNGQITSSFNEEDFFFCEIILDTVKI